MKNSLIAIILASVFISCKKDVKVLNVPVSVETSSEECYKGIFKNDTVSMHLHIKGDQVTEGELHYRIFEKDKNDGTLAGQIKGDTLFAVYTFQSEGKTSKREVAFLKKGATYSEGFGETSVDPEGNPIFKDPRQLKFDGNMVLSKINCE